MEMPTLPTDNLYKFMAIAGLLLFAGTIYFPTMLQIQLDDQLTQNNESIKILAADLDFTEFETAKMGEIITNSILQQEGKYTIPTNKMILSYSESEIKQLDNEMRELLHQNKINVIKIHTNDLRTDHLKFLIGLTKKVQYVLFFISIFSTITGFKLWYGRIQKYIDQEVRHFERPKTK